MDCKEMQDNDIMSLEYEKSPLWTKKEGKKTCKMRLEARFRCMEIQNSKI